MKEIQVKICNLVPPGEIWFVDSKKIVLTKIIDMDSTKEVSISLPDFTGCFFESELLYYKKQLNSNIFSLLQEKTNWGVNELMVRLTEIINEASLTPNNSEESPF